MVLYIVSTISCCEDVHDRFSRLLTLGLIKIAFSLFCHNQPAYKYTGATFYVEIFHENQDVPSERLFECPATPKLETRTPQSFFCLEVTGKPEKKRIYSIANFYMVTLPRVKSGEDYGQNQFILLGFKNTPATLFVGVPIVDTPLDWPNLVEERWDLVFSLLKQQCKNKIQPYLLGNVRMDTIAAFMSIADFQRFARPISRMIEKFKAYSLVLENIARTYQNDLHNLWHKLKNKSRGLKDTKALNDVRLAIQLLVQKLIDPCSVLSRDEGFDSKAAREAEALCRVYCRFLSVGFSVFPGTGGRDCKNLLGTGYCTNRRQMICMCTARVSYLAGLISRIQPRTMAMCSNALRIGIRRFTSHTPINYKGTLGDTTVDIEMSPERLAHMQQAVDQIESMAKLARSDSSGSDCSVEID